jgi:anti-sigma factor ChrR (cupin superfamily)
MSTHPSEDDRLDPALDAALLDATAATAPPASLRAKVLARVAAEAWREVEPGMQVKTLYYDRAGGMVSFLLRAQPGVSMPAHVHTAVEECLVLEGEFLLGEHLLRAGDFELGEVGQHHPVSITHTGVLVYLRGAAADYSFAVP